MNPEKAKYLAENLELRSRTDRLWLNNPVVMQGLGLAPLVVAATTGRNALILAMADVYKRQKPCRWKCAGKAGTFSFIYIRKSSR